MKSVLRPCCDLPQAQLRGLIGDYKDTDEGALATGLEAFDMLNNVLEEHQVCGYCPGLNRCQTISGRPKGERLCELVYKLWKAEAACHWIMSSWHISAPPPCKILCWPWLHRKLFACKRFINVPGLILAGGCAGSQRRRRAGCQRRRNRARLQPRLQQPRRRQRHGCCAATASGSRSEAAGRYRAAG